MILLFVRMLNSFVHYSRKRLDESSEPIARKRHHWRHIKAALSEYPLSTEAVCKRDPLMLLGLGMATRLEHSASFERSSGRRLGPHRLQERPDAEDFDHSFQVVGQNVKAHLRFDLF
jgi:hypothetical protein